MDSVPPPPLTIQQIDPTDTTKPRGLYEDLDPEDHARALKQAHERLMEIQAFNEEKNLERDLLTIPGQKFCVVSWVGPTFRAKTTEYGFRIMGAFKSQTSAESYAKKMHEIDNTYDIGIMEMNLWCLGFPSDDDIIRRENGSIDTGAMEKKRDTTLNEFIIRHKKEIEEARAIFEIRKLAIKKSTIVKEADEHGALISAVPTGRPTEEMERMHSKWAETMGGGKTMNMPLRSLPASVEYSKIDLYRECPKVPNQEYAVVSFVGHTGCNNRIPICIKGVFPTREETEEHIIKLMQLDDTYDLVPVPLYCWVPTDPDISKLRYVYKDKKLNTLLETDENQKENALALHQAKITHGNLDQPINPDYEGKGTLMTVNEEPEEETLFETGPPGEASAILKGMEDDGLIATFSFKTAVDKEKNYQS